MLFLLSQYHASAAHQIFKPKAPLPISVAAPFSRLQQLLSSLFQVSRNLKRKTRLNSLCLAILLRTSNANLPAVAPKYNQQRRKSRFRLDLQWIFKTEITELLLWPSRSRLVHTLVLPLFSRLWLIISKYSRNASLSF